MDAVTLSRVMGGTCSMARYEELAPAFNRALVEAGCTTVARVAMFCAQVGTESAGLKYMQEIDPGYRYEGRRDLGNIYPGDGHRFRGHGPIQITGRHNHLKVSQWAHAHGYVPTATFFVDHPEQLASDTYGFLGVVWYWTVERPMNRYADTRNILGATRAVNGGTMGLRDRTARWVRALALGAALLPSSVASTAILPEQTIKLDDATTKHLQTVLKVTADGIIGPQTITAWQKRMGTVADGVVSSPKSGLVSAVQSFLNAVRAGIVHDNPSATVWQPLTVDGSFGPLTAAAITKYLNDFNGGFTTGH